MYDPECVKSSLSVGPKPTQKLQCEPQRRIYSSNDPIFTLDLQLGRWDNRLLYKLFDNVLVGDQYSELSDRYRTCLATQSSLEKMASLIEVAANWNGPISIATFAASEEELNSVLTYIAYLNECNAKISNQVVFHLAFPKDRLPKQFQVDFDKLKEMSCSDPYGVLQELTKTYLTGTSKWRTKLPYPQNHLRNLARKNCQSKFVFLTDVDIIPSNNMAENLDIFLGRTTCNGQCAYVIPTYEVDERAKFPFNKTELIRLANKGLARPFHHKVFIYNQYATNFSK